MKQEVRRKFLYIGLGINVVLTVFLLISREQITIHPWETGGTLELPTYNLRGRE
jgi:hypothetical protein